MATLELNNILFKGISGKVGDLVFRQKNGKTIISRRPVRSKNKSKAGIERENRFRLNSNISKCINKIEVYNEYWKREAKGKMSTYNAVMKANYPVVEAGRFNTEPMLTPNSMSLDFSESGICFDSGIITIELKNDLIGIVRDFKIEEYIAVAGVICLYEPKRYELDECVFFDVNSNKEKYDKDGINVLSIELNEYEVQMINEYSQCMFYFGFVSLDKNGKVINEVSTFGEDLFEVY